jgi:hypothetical protein
MPRSTPGYRAKGPDRGAPLRPMPRPTVSMVMKVRWLACTLRGKSGVAMSLRLGRCRVAEARDSREIIAND